MLLKHLYNENPLKFKGLNVIIIDLVFFFFFINSVQAQDIHFSQFLTTPLSSNPANTGIIDEDLRVANNYRNQWAQIDVPYNTYYISIDKKLTIRDQLFGIGAYLLHDQSSSSRLSVEKFFLSVSYSKFYNNQQFVIGIQPGFVYKYFNSNSITFGSQFDPVTENFNPGLPSQENDLNDNTNYFDLNTGVAWRTYIRTLSPMAGFSVSHILRPVESFMNTGKTRLEMKYTFQGQLGIPLVKNFDITPCLLFGYTPGAREFVAGGIGGYNPENFFIPVKRLYVMNLYRINPARNIDAAIIGGGVKFYKIDIGVSYDINVSSLREVTNFRGAFEISLVYTGGKLKSRSVIEPCNVY